MKHGFIILLCFFITACSDNQDVTLPEVNSNQGTENKTVLSYQDVSFTDTVRMMRVKKGSFIPLYGNKKEKVVVDDFRMDVHPVTNRQYRQFVQLNPHWRKSNVTTLYADGNYLCQWINDTTLAEGESWDAPVTNISWFAASAYSRCVGKQLPSVNEWEYTAMADAAVPDARTKKSYNQFILSWYEKPKTRKQAVKQTFKNYWGIWDLHGLVWEWTHDFNEIMLSGESRRDVSNDENMFCGSGSVGASDLMDYAAFMRYAFRGSLKANYCIQNLGFRCIKK